MTVRTVYSFTDSLFKWLIFPLSFSMIFGLHLMYPESRFVLITLLIYSTLLVSFIFIKTLYNKSINLFILFAFSYLIPLYYYTFGNKVITSYNHSNDISLLIKYTLLYGLFFTVISVFIPSKVYSHSVTIIKKDNYVIFYINVIMCLLIAFFSKSGENLLSSGGYGQSEISNIGGFAIGEYFLIFFFVAFKFSGDKKINHYVLLVLAGIYIVESLAFGLRNEFIQLSILLFILYYKEKGKSIGYFIFIILGLYFSSLFAAFRSNPIAFLQSSIVEMLSPENIIDNESDNYISHQGDVIHSSSRIINFRDEDLVSTSTIISSSIFFFSSSIIPQKYLPEQANMAAYKKDDYPAGGGGSIFSYFYFWFWYPGVILIGAFIGLLVRYRTKYLNTIYGAYIVLVFSTFPRWFSYSPINLFKMCVYGLVIYFGFSLIDRYMKDHDN